MCCADGDGHGRARLTKELDVGGGLDFVAVSLVSLVVTNLLKCVMFIEIIITIRSCLKCH